MCYFYILSIFFVLVFSLYPYSLILKMFYSDPMSYRCLICNVMLDSPQKLEIHLQIEHNWGVKKNVSKEGIGTWT